MSGLTDFRAQHPEYGDMSDQALSDALYKKFYSDIPRADFDKKMGSAAPPPQRPDLLNDVVQSAGSGLATGTIGMAGAAGDFASLPGKAASWVAGLFGKSPQEQEAVGNSVRRSIPFLGMAPTSGEVMQGVNSATGWKPYQPQTELGKNVNKVTSFVPGALAIGATGGTAAIPWALGGAVTSGIASQNAGNVAATVFGEQARPYGEFGGALAGGVLPGAFRRAVTPFPVPANPTRTANVAALQNEGVTDLTAGQRSGSVPLRYFESEVGGPHVAQTTQNQGEQFTRATLQRAGINANRATPDVIDAGFTRIGNDFNQLAARNSLLPDPQFRTDVTQAGARYVANVGPPNQAPIVANYVREIGNAVRQNNGALPGNVYQSLRSRITADAKGAGDQYVQRALNEMGEALDDAMERSISMSNPQDLGLWREARRQYRNMLVIERAATGAGERTAEGIISPAQLQTATKAVTGRRAFARGNTQFDELSRAGVNVMSPLPQSGTAPRLAARTMLTAPALLGMAVGGKYGAGDLTAAAAGGAAGAATSAAARAFLNSEWGRRYLANQLLQGGAPLSAQLAAPTINATLPYRLSPPRGPQLPALR